nr:formylglycine-generating enzyme family protein [Rubellimicrobium arenae]
MPTDGAAEGARSPDRGPGARDAPDDVPLPGGAFLMGDHFAEGYHADGETPVHAVLLSPFAIDRTAVTNARFAAFVAATGYRTTAEAEGSSAVFHLDVAAGPDDVVGDYGTGWWRAVRGADWRHPGGPLSSIRDRMDHPVVHVSHHDALAFCRWAGRDLPTEAQWEYAARGGLEGFRFPWGDDLTPDGRHLANIWQGEFPVRNAAEDGWHSTAPVGAFDPNGFGLDQMVGNVWEWCADWFSPTWYVSGPQRDPAGPAQGTRRVTRGGSYLCHASYCSRYRVAARNSNTPDSSASNQGFRTVSAYGPVLGARRVP